METVSDPPEDVRQKRYTVTLENDLVRKVRVIAATIGMSVPEFVNDRLTSVVEQELPHALEAMAK